METREILKKADKGTLTWEKVDGGKIRFTSLGWDDAVVTKPNEVLEIETRLPIAEARSGVSDAPRANSHRWNAVHPSVVRDVRADKSR